ncbi:MAG TPA: YkgJ family cysteine cluster protein [Caulobacteraceae bacterium]|nr:YkgJ family cysteine cluster protein [Caulobacteraceae bacterium]
MSDPLEPPIRLAVAPPEEETWVEGHVSLKVSGERMEIDVAVPTGPANLTTLLPVFQGFTDAIVARGTARAVGEGRQVSCRAGCGVCCRQPVPISEPEAHALAALVEAMPEPRRTEVRARFTAIERRLEESGLAAQMGSWLEGDNATVLRSGLDYMRLWMACPFLEAESCSIYPDRPLICREYLVTTPAENCANPGPETIERVEIAGRPSSALVYLGKRATEGGWLLLVNALSFAAKHADAPAQHPAPAVVQAVFGRIAGVGKDAPRATPDAE